METKNEKTSLVIFILIFIIILGLTSSCNSRSGSRNEYTKYESTTAVITLYRENKAFKYTTVNYYFIDGGIRFTTQDKDIIFVKENYEVCISRYNPLKVN